MKNKKVWFIICLTLLFTGVVLLYQSYAIFEIDRMEKGNITIKVGTMEPTLKVDGVETQYLTIGAGQTKTFNVTLENLNDAAGQFILYYIDGPTGVAYGYIEQMGADIPPNNKGVILDTNEKQTYKIKMTNYNTTEKTLALSIDSGLSTGGKSMHPMGKVIAKYQNLNLAEIITQKHGRENGLVQMQAPSNSQQSTWKVAERWLSLYQGRDVNNYVYFNCSSPYDKTTCETWRIFGSYTIDNGTNVKEKRVKLVRSQSIETSYHPQNLTDFYNKTGKYSNVGLTPSARSQIGDALFYTAVINGDVDATTLFKEERGTSTIAASDFDSATEINQISKVELPYPSDYAYTYPSGDSCLNDLSLCNGANSWAYPMLQDAWLLNISSYERQQVDGLNRNLYNYFYVGAGNIDEARGSSTNHKIFPTLYLDKDIKAISGTGSKDNPFFLQPLPNENILNVYQYDETLNSSTFCVTGEESTCVELVEKPNNYKEGTIVKYKVNDDEIFYFFVISDNGNTLTLQQRENTIDPTAWYQGSNNNTYGPTTIIPILESATSNWSNVLDQTYTLGTTTFKSNYYTGCTSTSCTKNTYTLPSRTAKARMISMQEAIALGCKTTQQSCPIWMYNYLYNSTGFGGTVDAGTSKNTSYWTLSADSTRATSTWNINFTGLVNSYNTSSQEGGRAVIMIDK